MLVYLCPVIPKTSLAVPILSILFFSLLQLTFPAVTLAQNSVVIRGQVLDDEQKPVEGAQIDALKKGAFTDADGRFVFTIPTPTDTFSVRCFYTSYRTWRETVSPAGRDTLTFNIQLEPLFTKEIVVTGRIEKDRNEEIISLVTLQSNMVDKFGVGSIEEVMRTVPGYANNGQVSLRGSSGFTYGAGSRVLTLLNGLPMMVPSLGSTNFNLMPTDNLRQVEVYKGASSVLYGSGALGGVINAITEDPTSTPKTTFRARVLVGDTPANDSTQWDGRSSDIIHSRKVGEQFYITAQVDHLRNSGRIKDMFDIGTRALLNTRYDVKSVPGLTFRLNTQSYIQEGFQALIWNGYPVGANLPRQGFDNVTIVSQYTIDPSISYATQNGKHRFVYQGRTFLMEEYFYRYGNRGEFNNYFNELQHTWYIRPNWTLVSGGSHTLATIRADDSFGRAKSDQYAVFTQLDAKLTRRLAFNAGFRYQLEYISGDTTSTAEERNKYQVRFFTMANPIFRGGLNYRLGSGTFVRAGAGQAVRSPSVAERFTQGTISNTLSIVPNPEIGLEKGYSAELAVRQLFASQDQRLRGFVDFAAFTMQFDNMVEVYLETEKSIELRTPTFMAQNVPDARIRGLELMTQVDWDFAPNWKLGINGGVTFLDPRDLNGRKNWNGDDSVSAILDAVLLIITNQPKPEGFRIPADNPSFLKYRSRWMVRNSLDLRYRNVTLTTFMRYDSEIINVDKLFLIEELFPGTRYFRDKRRGLGNLQFDLILGMDFPGKTPDASRTTLSLIVNNVFNAELAYQPGVLAPQRQFGLQFKVWL